MKKLPHSKRRQRWSKDDLLSTHPFFGTQWTQKQRTKLTGDSVNHPDHYNCGGIECIDAIAAATADLKGLEAFCTANAIKYLWRWKNKGGKQDLDKAMWYIEKLISAIEA